MSFDMNKFFKIGIFCFISIGILNFYSLINMFRGMSLSAILSSLVSIFFNFVIAYFFYYSLKQQNLAINIDEIEEQFKREI